METHIKKWGNSLGVRIPASLAKQLFLKDGNTVDIRIEKNHIAIYPKKYHLEDMLDGMNKDNIHKEEFATSSKGKEVW